MPRFTAHDGTKLAYRETGDGPPLLCVPGGPGRAASYLGDLGGLDRHRTLLLLDNRGTGDSDVPADPATYRRDRLAADVDALRAHLGLDRVDLLGHSAGAGIAMAYAEQHPDRLASLVLLTPALRAVGASPTEADWGAHLGRHAHQPWYAEAAAALTAWSRGDDTPANRLASSPLFYGRWDDQARAHAAAETAEAAPAAAAGYDAEGAFSPGHTRRALASLDVPVLVHAGGADPVSPPHLVRQLADLIPSARYVEQPDAGHFPWLDDPDFLVDHLHDFPNPGPRAAD
ncbi:pimeloyl-ACP methyl ester carboxylesterase [Saccharothrix ecbatanensis]|uniref:Pimeloyl-ACP methyl ester carboxylesterase n=1 Tax=Saccharothrix ecbatanensis TaxID=1105145 RepID=A0A7W9HIE5_9PSEU|nr:alpha/beta hydrolase [Saccharothrix ecbatanensis]MBB5802536.1 pimeloyl-ACP methyl ester carboxylesterase [Saccharothrix ecbatanensis]